MVVGGKDTGKTTVTQPSACVYKSMPNPQSDSFCPLESIPGYELFLWQDLRHSPGNPDKDQQGLCVDEGTWSRWLEGLPTLVGVPKTGGSSGDFVYDEDAAFLFTGPFEFVAYRNRQPDPRETEQLSTRVKYVHFATQAPPAAQFGKTKPCGRCWSRWVLSGGLQHRAHGSVEPDAFARKVLATLWPDWDPSQAPVSGDPDVAAAASAQPQAVTGDALLHRLATLIEWRSLGHLTEEEFRAAKRGLGLVLACAARTR